MADLNRFRALGQKFQQEGADAIRQNFDEPVQQQLQVPEPLAPFKGNLSGDPTMPPGAMNSGGDMSASQVQGTDDRANLIARDRQIKEQLMQQAAEQARSEAEFDPSQYQQAISPSQSQSGRFERVKQALASQAMPPVSAPLPPTMQGGMIELSDDPEEQQRQIEAARAGR